MLQAASCTRLNACQSERIDRCTIHQVVHDVAVSLFLVSCLDSNGGKFVN